MFCGSCGNSIPDGAKFCPKCGAALSAPAVQAAPMTQPTPTMQTAPAMQAPPMQTAPAIQPTAEEKKKRRFGKARAKKDESAQQPQQANETKDTARKGLPEPSVGGAMLLAFFSLDCVPYLLKALFLVLTKKPLAAAAEELCGILGAVLAVFVLFAAAKLLHGKNRLPSAALLIGLITGLRTVHMYTLGDIPAGTPQKTIVLYCVSAAAGVAAGILMLIALRRVFSENDSFRQGGTAGALAFTLAALLSPSLINAALFLVMPEQTPSFMNTFIFKLTADLAQAGLMTLAVKRLLKKQTPSFTGKGAASFVQLIAGAALTAAAFIVPMVTGAAYSPVKAAVSDITGYMIDGRLCMNGGDMISAQRAFATAGEHMNAWRAVAENGSYSVPSEYSGDTLLEYLTYINSGADELRVKLVSEYSYDETDIWGPLMLLRYSEKEELSDDEQAHRDEMLGLCIATQTFTSSYPTFDEIQKKSGDITAALGTGESFDKDIKLANAFAGIQKGESSASSAIDELLGLAEEYPQDVSIQYAAAVIGSENRWDGASHYEKTCGAVLRFVSLWEQARADVCESSEEVNVRSEAAEMLYNIGYFDKAAELLETVTALSPTDGDALQKLASCYSELGDTKKNYEIISKLYEETPDDVTVLHSYFIGSLKKGDTKNAIEAAGRLADNVMNDDKPAGELDGDALLFNAVTYLAMNDSETYTDFRYMVYSEDTADEAVREINKNELLAEYTAAIYYEKTRGEPEKALPHAEKALRYQERSARLWYLNGLILFELERFDESAQALEKANELCPDDMSIMYALANTYDGLGRYQEAYDYCVRVINKYPNGADHDEDEYGVAPHALGLKNSLSEYVKEGS